MHPCSACACITLCPCAAPVLCPATPMPRSAPPPPMLLHTPRTTPARRHAPLRTLPTVMLRGSRAPRTRDTVHAETEAPPDPPDPRGQSAAGAPRTRLLRA